MNSQFSIGFGIALVLGIAVGAFWPKYGPDLSLQNLQGPRAVQLMGNANFDQAAHRNGRGQGQGHRGQGASGQACGGGHHSGNAKSGCCDQAHAGSSGRGCGGHSQGASSGGCDGQCENAPQSATQQASHRGQAGQGRGYRNQERLVANRGGRQGAAQTGHGQAGNGGRRSSKPNTTAGHDHGNSNCSGMSCSSESSSCNASSDTHASCNASQGNHQGRCSGEHGDHAEHEDVAAGHEHGQGPGMGLGMGRGWRREMEILDGNVEQEVKQDEARGDLNNQANDAD